jgi:hypothetical protein
MKNHILETYTKRFAILPKVQQILAQLPDDAPDLVFNQIHPDAYDDDIMSKPADVRARLQRTQVRRMVPVLDPLSDQELDDVISVAIDVATNPYLDRDESVRVPERRRDMEITPAPERKRTMTPAAHARLLVERKARADFWNRLEVSLEFLRDNNKINSLRILMRDDYPRLAAGLEIDTADDAKLWAMLRFALDICKDRQSTDSIGT